MKDSCFLITKPIEGGGNILSHPAIIVRRSAAIGDALAATVVADKLAEAGFETAFQTHPNIHCVVKHCPNVSSVAVPNGFCHIDLDGAYETNPSRRFQHFSDMFVAVAQRAMSSYSVDLGPARNCRPVLKLNSETKAIARARFTDYPHPWIFICPRSDTYIVRQVPDGFWAALAPLLPGTKFWVGRHPSPAGFVDLQVRHMDNMVAWLSAADLLVSVDTGPAHIGIALGVQAVMLGQSSSPDLHFSDQRDFETVWPAEKLECLNCQQNICPKNHYSPPCQNFSKEQVATTVIRKLQLAANQSVAAVISVYRPEAPTLNRCLQTVGPQVDEVVVCSDQGGIVPDTAASHTPDGKMVRYVKSNRFDIGYGRKQNFCARHTCSEFLLLLNDDVFLDPGAVAKMKEVMVGDPKIGMVSNLLRYPDGTIYHAGKVRSPGQKGWSHINHRHHLPDFKEPLELENCCGACVLVRRKAFYDIAGFDEDFYLYAEDDDMALRMRYAGYKIFFTPHSTGVHIEHQSTSKTGPIAQILTNSNRLFGKKWGKYLEWNSDRIPGNFDYLRA